MNVPIRAPNAGAPLGGFNPERELTMNDDRKKTRRPRRYLVSRVDYRSVLLRVYTDCALGEAGDERQFFVAAAGGYVHEWIGSDLRQVCDRLSSRGPTLRSTGKRLLDDVRREAAALLRWAAAEEKRPW